MQSAAGVTYDARPLLMSTPEKLCCVAQFPLEAYRLTVVSWL
jgi:hypothetical protein